MLAYGEHLMKLSKSCAFPSAEAEVEKYDYGRAP